MKSYVHTRVTLFCTFLAVASQAQQATTLNGIVIERAGNRLVGCNVVIKGTPTGTTTDSCGIFTLEAGQDITLSFNHISYKSYEVFVRIAEVRVGEPVVFQLVGIERIRNKRCKQKIENKKARWYKLG